MAGARGGEPREAETLADLPAGGLAAARHLVAHLQPSTLTNPARGVVASVPPPLVPSYPLTYSLVPSPILLEEL